MPNIPPGAGRGARLLVGPLRLDNLQWVALAAALLALAPGFLRLLGRAVCRVRLARSGIRRIDRMDGPTFEAYLEILFRRLGYHVQRTRASGDFGADLIVERDGVRTAVQAKRYAKAVGLTAVQEAAAARGKYGCDAALVVTNSTFTRPARELAEANGVELWDREELIRRALSRGARPAPVPERHQPPAGASSHLCAACGQPVSARDRQHSLNHARRYAGRVYCYRHLPR